MIELDELRQEHQQRVIGKELAGLLAKIVDSTAPTYPPTEYSTSGTWDRAALDDAAQDWVLTRLLERGDLSVLLTSARSTSALRSMLTRSFRQHLVNRRRRTSATNLFSRTKAMLQSDPSFTAVGLISDHGEQLWKLADSPTSRQAAPGTVERLIKAAAARSDTELGVVRYGPYSLKSSPILRASKLHEFVVYLLTQADGYLSTAEMFQVMRHRFNLFDPTAVELDPVLSENHPHVLGAVENHMLARSVLRQLGYKRLRLIKALEEADYEPEAAAQGTGSPVSAVVEALDRMQALIAEYAETIEAAEDIQRLIIESLYGEDETR